LKVEPADEKVGRYKSYRLRQITRMNSSMMTKINLNYVRNRRRRLGKTFEDIIRRGQNRYIKYLVKNDAAEDDL